MPKEVVEDFPTSRPADGESDPETPVEKKSGRRKNGLFGEVSRELLENMRKGWAVPPARPPALTAQAAHTACRRAALSARFPNERLVVPAGHRKRRSNDTNFRFRAATEYVHLTGDQTEGGVLVLEPLPGGGHEHILYLTPPSDRESGEFWLDSAAGELWTGPRMSLAENEARLGITCRDRRTVREHVLRDSVPVRAVHGYDTLIDASLAERTVPEYNEELIVHLSELRLLKDEFEVRELQKAVNSTVRGFEDVVRALGRAQVTSERYVEGTFSLRARVEGNDVGYHPICASGPNACTLHWTRNDGAVRAGDLLLLDAGVETHSLYTADLTRTLPVAGAFGEMQRRVYDAVFDAQEAGIAVIRPGARYRDVHDAAQRVLAQRLVAWGILEGPVERVLACDLQRRWTLHGTGHMLGMDVHDCAAARTEAYVDATLRPGMCLTVEPGLYFQSDDLTVPKAYRGIGVRIEDDILVTADGHRNMSSALPRRADHVEAWMAELRGPLGAGNPR
ncbi:aminopeptidase P family protein [Kitasatospora indigofera]|uniref:aminopeptidase P family protein n=1 Tax=Kitasatospora indigofera TaxID=67307 RepID=UPI0036CF8476